MRTMSKKLKQQQQHSEVQLLTWIASDVYCGQPDVWGFGEGETFGVVPGGWKQMCRVAARCVKMLTAWLKAQWRDGEQ